MLQQPGLQAVGTDIGQCRLPALGGARALGEALARVVVEAHRGERDFARLALHRLGAHRALVAEPAVAAVARLGVIDAHPVVDEALVLAHRGAVEVDLGGLARGIELPGLRGGGGRGEEQGTGEQAGERWLDAGVRAR